MARGARDETGRERDGGDHGYDPRRREGARKPKKNNVGQENERRKAKILKENRNFKPEKSRKQKDKTKCERQAKTKQRHGASKQSYFQNVVESERGGFQRRRCKLQVARHAGTSFGEALGRTAESEGKVEKETKTGEDVH